MSSITRILIHRTSALRTLPRHQPRRLQLSPTTLTARTKVSIHGLAQNTTETPWLAGAAIITILGLTYITRGRSSSILSPPHGPKSATPHGPPPPVPGTVSSLEQDDTKKKNVGAGPLPTSSAHKPGAKRDESEDLTRGGTTTPTTTALNIEVDDKSLIPKAGETKVGGISIGQDKTMEAITGEAITEETKAGETKPGETKQAPPHGSPSKPSLVEAEAKGKEAEDKKEEGDQRKDSKN